MTLRWIPVVAAAAIVACGGDEPPSAATPAAAATTAAEERPAATATPAAGPRWPGPVAFASERARLDVFVRDRGRTRRLTRGNRDEFSPNWAPGGDEIAYRVNPPRGDEGDIWTMSARGTGKRNLTRSPGVADWSPAFSPDGKQIAYMSSAGGGHELWRMDRDGANQRQLTRANELSEYPTWSPDGKALAFSGIRGGNFEVVRIAASGGAETNLTHGPASDKWPAWSPDGTQIAFVSDRDGDDDVFLMNADGSAPRNLSNNSGLTETHPTWTPDGRLSFLQHGETGPVHVRVVDPARGDYDLPVDAVFVYDWG